jgi:hypothetical protein
VSPTTQRIREQFRAECLAKINAMRAAGVKLDQCLAAAGISTKSYYNWTRKGREAEPAAGYVKGLESTTVANVQSEATPVEPDPAQPPPTIETEEEGAIELANLIAELRHRCKCFVLIAQLKEGAYELRLQASKWEYKHLVALQQVKADEQYNSVPRARPAVAVPQSPAPAAPNPLLAGESERLA